MNKNDIKLVLLLLLIVIIFFLFKSSNKGNVANIYYNDELIKTISLDIDDIYTVNGYNGEVVIEVKDNKVRVIEEVSNRNLCSKQGYGEVIVCLPNRIVIKVEKKDNELDGVVR